MKSLKALIVVGVATLWMVGAPCRDAHADGAGNNLAVKETSLGNRRFDFLGLETVSNNGQHIAYAAGKLGAGVIVVDGVAGKSFENLGTTLVLSPDGTPAFYVQVGAKYRVVYGATESQEYDGILEDTPILSADGKRVAFGAARGNKRLVVTDGQEGREYDLVGQDCLTFSSDGKHVAFRAQSGGKQFVVLDGVEGKQYDGIGDSSVSFSSDGKRVAYAVTDGGTQFFVIDGIAQRTYQGLGGKAALGLDDNHFAYDAQHDGKWFVVVDNKEGKGFDGIGFVTISDHGGHFSYAAQDGNSMLAVHDDEEGKEYSSLVLPPIMSPDGKHLAYAAKRDDGAVVVVVDRKESNSFDRLERVAFSPDSTHVAFIGNRAGKWYVVVDGKESAAYDQIPGAKLFFNQAGVLTTVAQRANEYLKLEIVPAP